jgi:hypothetical protein
VHDGEKNSCWTRERLFGDGEAESFDHRAKSESGMTSTHPSLGRLCTPLLAEDSGDGNGEGDPDADSLRRNLNPISLMGSVHQHSTHEPIVHWAPVTSIP